MINNINKIIRDLKKVVVEVIRNKEKYQNLKMEEIIKCKKKYKI